LRSFNKEDPMKKALALAMVTIFCAAVALAESPEDKSGKAMEGTISKLDMSAKSMAVKASDGVETTVYWNDATKVRGEFKEGEQVHVRVTEKDGKTWASWVHVGKMEPKK
jgi:maltose-binding protein MalE